MDNAPVWVGVHLINHVHSEIQWLGQALPSCYIGVGRAIITHICTSLCWLSSHLPFQSSLNPQIQCLSHHYKYFIDEKIKANKVRGSYQMQRTQVFWLHISWICPIMPWSIWGQRGLQWMSRRRVRHPSVPLFSNHPSAPQAAIPPSQTPNHRPTNVPLPSTVEGVREGRESQKLEACASINWQPP